MLGKSLRFVPFGANLTHFGAKPTIPGETDGTGVDDVTSAPIGYQYCRVGDQLPGVDNSAGLFNSSEI